jgi:hypothetical protein
MTRPQQVRQMIETARAAGVPFAWFTADEEFGHNPGLCTWLQETGACHADCVSHG